MSLHVFSLTPPLLVFYRTTSSNCQASAFCIYCTCASTDTMLSKSRPMLSSCFRSHSLEPTKAKKLFAVPRHPIKIGPRAYDGFMFRKTSWPCCLSGWFWWKDAVSLADSGDYYFIQRISLDLEEGLITAFKATSRQSKGRFSKLLSSSRLMHSRRNNRPLCGKDTTTHVGIFANQERAPFGDTKARKGKQYASLEDD